MDNLSKNPRTSGRGAVSEKQKKVLITLGLLALTGTGYVVYDGLTGYDAGVAPCDLKCYNCSDCIDALNNDTIDYVCLNNSISSVGDCIDDPDNFTGKTLDCQDFTISGDGTGSGIELRGKNNNNITNCTITNFYYGIELRDGSNYTIVKQCNVSSNVHIGIRTYGVALDDPVINTTIEDNIVENNVYGITITATGDNTTLNRNVVCSSTTRDITNDATIVYGDNNTCNTSSSWNDTGEIGCTWQCPGCYQDFGDGTCECSDCSGCNLALADVDCNITYLNKDISYNGTLVAGTVDSCIDFPSSDKVFDCLGYTIDGNDSYNETSLALTAGITINSETNNTIRNCIVSDYYYSIRLINSGDDNSLINNTGNSSVYGFFLHWSSNNNIINNTGNDNSYDGINLWYFSDNNTVTGNMFNDNAYNGIYLTHSSDRNNFSDNTIAGNADGIFISGSNDNYFYDNIVQNSTEDGIQIQADSYGNNFISNEVCFNNDSHYDFYNLNLNYSNTGMDNWCDNCYNWEDEDGSSCAHGCTVCYCSSCDECELKLNDVNCSEVRLTQDISSNGTCIDTQTNFQDKIFTCQGFTITGNGTGRGIYLYEQDDNEIDCNIENFYSGIYLHNSDLNDIEVNVSDNYFGIEITGSNNNSITTNVSDNNYGIKFVGSDNNTVSDSEIYDNNGYGIGFSLSDNNTIDETKIYDNNEGILAEYRSYDNNITNTISCSNTLHDVWHGGFELSETYGVNLTCDESNIYDNGSPICDYTCSPVVIYKYAEPDRIFGTTNVTYYFNITNTGLYTVSNMMLTDSVFGNVPLIPVGTNITRDTIYSNTSFLVNYTYEVTATTINNCTINGTWEGFYTTSSDAAKVEFISCYSLCYMARFIY